MVQAESTVTFFFRIRVWKLVGAFKLGSSLHRLYLVRVLGKSVELGDGVVESALGERARFLGLVLDLKVEHRVVEREAEADGMRRREALALALNVVASASSEKKTARGGSS